MSYHAPTPLQDAAPRLIDHPQLQGRQLGELGELVARTREFSRRTLRPRALELDRIADKDPGHFAWDIAAEGGKLGLLNLVLPKASGGDSDQSLM